MDSVSMGKRIALVSLCRRDDSAAGGYCGLLPIGHDTLLAYQIGAAQRAGAATIICHIDSVPGDLMRHEKMARDMGLEWRTVRQFGDLLANVMDDDELLVIGDGMYHSTELLDGFMAHDAPMALLASADDAHPGFERIDLNHLWAGLLRINRDQLDSLGEVPADWSLESVLLRTVTKAKNASVMLGKDELESDAVLAVENPDQANKISLSLIAGAAATGPKGLHPLSGYLVRLTCQITALWLWNRRESQLWMHIASAMQLVLMLVLIGINWPVTGMALGYIGYFSGRVVQALAVPDRQRQNATGIAMVMAAAGAAGMMLLLYRHTGLLGAAYIALIWLILQGLMYRNTRQMQWRAMAYDPLVLVITAGVSTLFDASVTVIAALTLVQASALLWAGWRKS